MAIDRFIDFKKKGPTKKETESVARHFFGEAAQEIRWNGNTLEIQLFGDGSFPFAEIEPEMRNPYRGERWITVVSGRGLDVVTRGQDDYTNTLAAGLAEVFARYWKGKVQPCD